MCGNGVGIGMTVLIIVIVQRMIQRVQIVGPAVLIVAAAGATMATTAVWLVAATIVLAIATAILGFAFCEQFSNIMAFLPFYLFKKTADFVCIKPCLRHCSV